MLIKWHKSLSSGIDAIDLQHRHIVNLLNDIVIANQKSSDREILDFSLIELNKAAREHFYFEEGLLQASGYTELGTHKASHEEIIEILEGLAANAILNEDEIDTNALNSVINWFKEHLIFEDFQYFKDLVSYLEKKE